MFMNRVVFCLIFYMVLCIIESSEGFGAYHHEFLREGDECIDEATGQSGLCTPINYCSSVVERLADFIENGTTCWYGKGVVILCCLKQNTEWVPPDQRTISQKMCLVYTKSISLWVVGTPPPLPTSQQLQPQQPVPSLPSSGANSERRSHSSTREVPIIFGGKPTKPQEFPHMAALGWPTIRGDLEFKCGGTLVSPLFVLTAGHCTAASSVDTEVTSVEPTTVRLGVEDLRSVSPSHSRSIDVSVRRIVRHPAYRPPAFYNDIALLELEAPVELNRFVRPGCLWHKEDFGEKKHAIVTGWGATSHNGQLSNTLLRASLTLFSNEFCQPLLQHLQNRKWKHGLSPEQMCAGDPERKHDSCRGDSGGPLQINFPSESKVFYVVGVTSFGDSCPAGSGAAVYTRVSSFIPWIESVVWPDRKDNKLNLTVGDI